MIFSSNLLFSQRNFSIELNAPSFVKKDIIFSPPYIRRGFVDIYAFKVDTGNNIIDFGKKFGFAQCSYNISIQEKNLISGEISYPIPVNFQRFNPITNVPEYTQTFFLDSGSYKIHLTDNLDALEININSEINNEYVKFRKIFSEYYIKRNSKESRVDSLIDLTTKERRLSEYIIANPNSYVALWEIISDYTRHSYDPIYLYNLNLFSTDIKNTSLFKMFENKLISEDSTLIGKYFPEIKLDKQFKLTKQSFKNKKLTFIDYWSTTCLPCIREMPKIVALYNEYKLRGVDFITITDENEPDRVALAKKILLNNKVLWNKYYDTKKNFNKSLNVTAYPLHLLVDQSGKIIARSYGNLNEVRTIIENYLK